MTIESKNDSGKLTMIITGRLDTTTAPDLETAIKEKLEGVTQLILDFGKLEYISSAGLRVLLSTQKIMNKKGLMKLVNVNSEIMDIFEITGFNDILTIE